MAEEAATSSLDAQERRKRGQGNFVRKTVTERAYISAGAGLLLAALCFAPLPALANSTDVAEAQGRVDEMNGIIQEAFDQLESARSEEDIQRVNCISEGVTVMRGLLKISEENMLSLREYNARGDARSAGHSAMKIAIAHKKFEELDSQVRSCGGPDLGGTVDGRPDIEKILDEDLPTIDPVEGLKDTDLFLERPPAASQFM